MAASQSKESSPVPSKRSILSRLKLLGVPISEVVDVGVRESTLDLIEAFPDHFHHLFEPVATFFQDIDRNYSNVQHLLYPIALSDRDENRFLSVTSLNRDGVATHSRIVDKFIPVDGKEVIACSPIDVRRFDSLDDVFRADFLLKVDVDGFDLEVLKGCGLRLKKASVVIIEATFLDFCQRTSFLEENGFQLVDIVDMAYYGSTLYQFDLAFIRRDLVNQSIRPPIDRFEPSLWRAFFPD